MRVHYNSYKTALENDKKSVSIYRELDGASLSMLMEMGARGKSGEAIIVATEVLWVREFDRLIYYVPQPECEFLLRSKYDCKIMGVQSLDVFAISAHPTLKIPPMLVEVTRHRFVVHIEGYKADRRGTHTIILRDGVDFEEVKEFGEEAARAAKLAYGLWMFKKAFPASVHDGFPEEMKERSIRYAKKTTGRHILLPAKYRTAPGAHTRSWHWRHLYAERFKRSADGSVKVILIPETIVGKIKAKTIVSDS